MRSRIILCLFIAVFLMPEWGEGGSEQRSKSFISPRIAIERTALQELLTDSALINFSQDQEEVAFLQDELAAHQPLAIARRLISQSPAQAGQTILNEVADDNKWKVLKKLPPLFIAMVLDTLKPEESVRIITRMKPLKAGLVLNAMFSREIVFSKLPLRFQLLLVNTPGPKQIVHATIEEAEFFRCGGLADVLKNLPRETAEQGDSPSVFMPLWSGIDKEKLNYLGSFPVPIDSPEGYHEERMYLFYAEIGDLVKYRIYFIENHTYFDVAKDEVFSGPMMERFILFNKAVLEGLRYLDMRPDIIHCHEWQTGLIPVYLKEFYQQYDVKQFRDTLSVYTSHNPVYDMKGPWDSFYMTGLDKDRFFRFDGLEINNYWSFSKAGLMFADLSNTVGKSIAEEARTQDFIGPIKNDLKGVYEYLSAQGRWFGIVNGGNENFRAETNPGIAAKFDVEHLDERIKNKTALQKNLGLEVSADKPVVAIIGRLTGQKGYDLILPLLMDILNRGGQLVSLGGASKTDPSGWQLQNEFKNLIEKINTDPVYAKYRNQISMNFTFGRVFSDGTNLEALICSGADIIIMPSRFEPCGLVQMNAAGCGGVIVAKRTQGLADTITPFDPKTGNGMGFLFDEHSPDSARQALLKAMDVFFNEPATWRQLQENNMNADFSWDPVFWEYRDRVYSRTRSSVAVIEAWAKEEFRVPQKLGKERVAAFLFQESI